MATIRQNIFVHYYDTPSIDGEWRLAWNIKEKKTEMVCDIYKHRIDKNLIFIYPDKKEENPPLKCAIEAELVVLEEKHVAFLKNIREYKYAIDKTKQELVSKLYFSPSKSPFYFINSEAVPLFIDERGRFNTRYDGGRIHRIEDIELIEENFYVADIMKNPDGSFSLDNIEEQKPSRTYTQFVNNEKNQYPMIELVRGEFTLTDTLYDFSVCATQKAIATVDVNTYYKLHESMFDLHQECQENGINLIKEVENTFNMQLSPDMYCRHRVILSEKQKPEFSGYIVHSERGHITDIIKKYKMFNLNVHDAHEITFKGKTYRSVFFYPLYEKREAVKIIKQAETQRKDVPDLSKLSKELEQNSNDTLLKRVIVKDKNGTKNVLFVAVDKHEHSGGPSVINGQVL